MRAGGRRGKGGLRIAVTAAIVAAALAFVGQARAGDLQFNDDYPSGDPPPVTLGANAQVLISGTIEYYGAGGYSCSDPNAKDDFFYPAADVYVIPSGGPLADGTELHDVSGPLAHTVIAEAAPLFLLDQIGVTAPTGRIGAGTYDIVYDECQDGKFTAGEDEQFPGALTVNMPANVPPIDPAVHDLKISAAKEAAPWLAAEATLLAIDAYQKVQEVLECIEAGPVGCAVSYVTDQLKEWMTEKVMTALGLQDPKEGMRRLIRSELQHWAAIAADPPDSNYASPVSLPPVDSLTAPRTDAITEAQYTVANDSALQGSLTEAILHAMERYQGADAASNGDAALMHARELERYTTLLGRQLAKTNADLDAYAAAVAADPRDFDTYASRLSALRDDIVAHGFTDAEKLMLRNAGLSDADISSLADQIAASDPAAGGKTQVAANVAALKSANDEAISSLQQTTASMNAIETQLLGDPNTFGLDPVADAGGPYVTTEGGSITLNGTVTHTNAGRTIVGYAWDLNGDGQFDDATTASPTVSFPVARSGLIGFRVTDDAGSTGTAYAQVTVSDVNRPPVITAATPGSSQASVAIGHTQTFSVTASDPDGDPVTIQWLVDGHAAGSGDTFLYTPSSADAGTHVIQATASDNRADGGNAIRDWGVRAVPPDADGDGYVAAPFSDCDDGDASVHPGAVEVVGNVKDDDCDPSTPDTGSPPRASFSATAGAAGSPVAFTDTSTDPNADAIGWAWTFGDGGTSSEQSPSHVYAASGTYTVSLTVTDATGNHDTVTHDVAVSDAPIADFTFAPASPASGGAVQFTDASHETNGSIAAWHWDFGDGQSSSEQNPEHTFTGVGDYDVELTVTDANGISGSITKTITTIAGDPATAPKAGFSAHGDRNLADGTGATGATVVSFSGSCQCGDHTPHNMLDANVSSLPWAAPAGPNQFAVIKLKGDGSSPIDRIGVQPRSDGCCPQQGVHDFAVDVSPDGTTWTQILAASTVNAQTLQMFDVPVPAAGQYVRYRPLSNWGDCCWYSTSRFMAITDHAGPAAVTFLNTSTNAVSYRWTFGDGASSTASAPSHTYAAPGAYTVTLVARSADGRSSTKTDTYTVGGVVPSFTHAPPVAAPGSPVAFDDTSSALGGVAEAGVGWDFGDGSTLSGSHVSHAYANAGSYSVRMTVTDDTGGTWSTTQVVTVGGAGVTLGAAFQPRLPGGETDVARDFRGATITAPTNTGRQPVTTLIDGDVNNGQWWSPDRSAGQSLLVTLPSARIVDGVRLYVYQGWWEMIHDFDVAVSSTTTDAAAFTTVAHGTTAWESRWQEFTFPAVKARYVRIIPLSVSNPGGNPCCYSLAGLQVISGSDGGATVTFHNLSTGADSYTWDFGDGTTSTDAEPTHAYSAPGTYTVTLTASKGGDSQTYSAEQVVSAATFAFAPGAPVDGDRVQFADGTSAGFGAKSWSWTFGDGGTSTFQNPMHIYDAPGAYQVTETVTSVEGTTSTVTKTVTVGTAGVSASFAAQAHFDAAASISGASIAAVSGQYDGCWIAGNMLHRLPGNCGTTAWASGNGVGGSPAWARVALAPAPGGGEWTIDSFTVTPRVDYEIQRPLMVELAVSDTGAAGSFSTVYQTALADNGTAQTFTLARPVSARYVEYRTFGNHGDSCCTSTTRLTVNGVDSVDGLTVSFANASRHASSYSWDFGDGSTSTAATPTHTYAHAGNYTVQLTACAAGSCDTATQVVRMLAPISASFEFTNLPAKEGQVVNIHDTSPPPGEGTHAYEDWTFGDGQSASAMGTVGHSWGDNGTYSVTESVTTTLQQTATATLQIQVANAPPTIELGADRQIYEKNWVDYNYAYGDPGANESLACTVDYGDGSAPEPGCGHAYHRYPAGPRTYTLTATIRDKDGASTTDTVQITTLRRAQTGYASVDYAEPFPGAPFPAPFNCCGPIGIAFDSANQAYVSDYATGYIYKFGSAGGTPNDAKKLPTPVGCSIAGLAFSKSGRLYGARQGCSDIVEIDPVNGGIVRTVATNVCRATGLATDPLSGDLFATTIGCNGYLYRIHTGEDGTPASAAPYTPSIGSVDGVTIGPDGTMWLELDGWLAKVAGTNQPNAGQTTKLVQIPYFDGVAISASSDPSQPSYIYANRNDGVITKIDLSTPTPTLTDIYKGGTRGDFVAVGPDGCLYATQSDSVIKLTFADGTCGLASTSVVPQLSLTPQNAAAVTGSQHTVTATLTNVLSPAGTVVTFTVTGAHAVTGTALADTNGVATFSYTGVNEGTDTITATTTVGTTNVASNPATVTWSRPPNSPPTAPDVNVSTPEDTPVDVTLPASDPDGDALTLTHGAPRHGTVTGSGASLTYTPDANYDGPDFFTYTASDGTAAPVDGVVTIDVQPVNDPPAADNSAVSTDEDTPLDGVLTASDADGDPLRYALASPTAHGTLTIAPGGAFHYVPDANYNGPDAFTWTVDDGNGGTDVGSTAITVVPVNDPPVGVDDVATTNENQALTLPSLAANDTDVDGDTLTVVDATAAPATHGTVSVSGGVVTYTPAPGYFGPATFVYRVTDGRDFGEASVYVDVIRTNRPPTIDALPGQTIDEGATASLHAAATDPDGDPITYSWTSDAGTLTPSGADATLFVDDGPAVAQVTVTVSDGQDSVVASTTVHVRNVAPSVTAAASPSPVAWGMPVHFAGSASDPSAADTAYGLVYRWNFGDGVLSPDDDLTYAYAAPGAYAASFTAVDKDGGIGSQEVDVTVTKRPTSVAFLAPTTQPFGPAQLSARLTDSVDAATAQVAGRTLVFAAGGRTFSAVTNGSGVATVSPAPFLLSGPVTVSFGGNALYLASAATVPLTITNAFGNGPGFFTLGDRTPTGGTVNWWGSQWEKTNVLSGGAAPAAFKGYVNAPAAQGCGGSWTTGPGNSSGPPPTVGPYLAVVVPSRVTKSGSTVAGNVVHILAVKTAAGYGPAPGHDGTGQVVGAVC